MVEISKFFAKRAHKATVPIHLLSKKEARAHLDKASALHRGWAKTHGFSAKPDTHIALPARDGSVQAILAVHGDSASPWTTARLATVLPKGRYELQGLSEAHREAAALGWGLAQYEFDRYRKRARAPRQLVWPEGVDQAHVTRLLEATFLVRDLVNTPANDLGPAELAQAAVDLAERFGASATVTEGATLEKEYPTVHAVGRAATEQPRYVDLRWGDAAHPMVTLVGKGVCFDSGGLNLKPGNSMLFMKKDMGGAAHVLGLALAIMDARLPVRLRVLVPAVENAVSGNAFRPLDVLTTRKGLTVEVGNTDAEGRLILCDALADACDESPELLIDFATLTGAARVALGTEIAAMFSNDDDLAADLSAASARTGDALWRLPLADDYDRYLKSHVADLSNIGSTSYGGAITAALFLRRFVTRGQKWVHFDVMAYNNDNRPGRPRGGEAMGLRAVYAMLEARYPRA